MLKILAERAIATADEDITIEESLDCRDANSRQFTLINRLNDLRLTISLASITKSCLLAGHEIIVNHQSHHHHIHDTWAHGDRPAQPLYNQIWISHVRGSELILSTLNATNCISYQLNRNSELITVTRLRSPLLQHQVHYFNLNSTDNRTSINGHTFHINSSDNRNLIVQNTKTHCNCVKDSPISPKSFIGDIPQVIVCDNEDTKQDIIICDAIFTLESIDANSFITADLQYEDRCLRLEVKPTITTNSLNGSSSSSYCNNSNNSASSSGSTFAVPSRYSSSHNQHIGGMQHQIESSNMGLVNQSALSIDSLKLRVRLTSFGVCLIPVMMSSYTCIYKFFY